MNVVSVNTAKNIDKCAINDYGIPSIALMETAAQEIFNTIKDMGNTFHVFCGEGNNGGDGLAIARKLIAVGKDVTVYIIGKGTKQTKEFQINYNVLKKISDKIIYIKSQEEIKECYFETIGKDQIVVDAILGVGLNRKVDSFRYYIIQKINECNGKVISVDTPSGLNGDSGKPMGISIKADITCSIQNYKKGFFKKEAQKYLGIIRVIGIGIPKEILKLHNDGICVLDKSDYKKLLPVRDICGHKGNYGKVVVLAGSLGLSGAAFLTASAAVNTGSGLVTLIVPKDIQSILSNKLTEAMTVNYSETKKIEELIKKADVIACGPGLSKNDINAKMLEKCINDSSCSIVIDADAINILSNREDLLDKLKGRCVITPHLGEFERITKYKIDEIEENKIEYCMEFSKDKDFVTVLKGYNSVISDGKRAVINRSGNSKMASGGMGDTLTGIIASLIGQKVDIYYSAVLGCYIHGLAGEDAGQNKYSVKASDIIERIPKIMNDILNL